MTDMEKLTEEKQEDPIVQFNIRLRTSVASAYRAYCLELGITQSEGLQLLLMSETFKKREQLIQAYQQKQTQKDKRIAELKQENDELHALQTEKESWVLRQRKEWIRVTKKVLEYVINQVGPPEFNPNLTEKFLRMKNKDGRSLFHACQYPPEAGCYEVTVKGIIFGLNRAAIGPDSVCPLFVCGELQDKTMVKFRYYPRKDYFGIRPTDNVFTCRKKPWMLGCVTAKDGAVELVCAVPMQDNKQEHDKIEDAADDLLAVLDSGRIKPSLNTQIQRAEKRV